MDQAAFDLYFAVRLAFVDRSDTRIVFRDADACDGLRVIALQGDDRYVTGVVDRESLLGGGFVDHFARKLRASAPLAI